MCLKTIFILLQSCKNTTTEIVELSDPYLLSTLREFKDKIVNSNFLLSGLYFFMMWT